MSKKDKKNNKNDQDFNKQKVLDEVLKDIEDKFGTGAVMKLGSAEAMKIARLPFAGDYKVSALDIALGGGLPKGRIIEIYGPESSGKTTLALHAISAAQANGGTAAFIDVEHALDPDYAKLLGVNIDNLIIAQPDSGEDALDITEKLVSSGTIDVIVVDSVAALVPRAEIEGEMGDQQMGLQARLMSKALRKLTSLTNKTGTVLIFINQVRMKIGISFGNPETTTGGNALKFYASVRLDIRKTAQIKDGENTIGARTKVKVVKNKTSPPLKIVEFDLMYPNSGTTGYNFLADILDLGVSYNIISKSGAFYDIDNQKIQGRSKMLQYLSSNPEVIESITSKLLNIKDIPTVEESEEYTEE